jgi:hypothetical protein
MTGRMFAGSVVVFERDARVYVKADDDQDCGGEFNIRLE